jgi:hypothetical protein
MTRHTFALLFTALLAGLMSSGCSNLLEEELVPEEEVRPPPPLLTFDAPLTDQTLSSADDLDAAIDGVQTDIVVRVRDLENDLALHDIEVQIADGAYQRVPLIEHAGGRFAVLEHVTLAQDLGRERVRIRARVALEGEAQPRAEIVVRPLISTEAVDPCGSRLELAGDLEVNTPRELPTSADCLVVGGDLIITGTDLESLDGFDAVVEVGGSVIVESNASLVDLDPWTTLERIGGDLVITDNPALSAEEVARLIDRVGLDDIGGDIVLDMAMD